MLFLILFLIIVLWRQKEQYVSSDLEIRPSGVHGKGVFTTRAIAKGETLFNAFPGKHPSVVLRAPIRSVDYYNKIASPYTLYINHCKRKCNVELDSSDYKTINLIAVRDIAAGEELLADYDATHRRFPFIAAAGRDYIEC